MQRNRNNSRTYYMMRLDRTTSLAKIGKNPSEQLRISDFHNKNPNPGLAHWQPPGLNQKGKCRKRKYSSRFFQLKDINMSRRNTTTRQIGPEVLDFKTCRWKDQHREMSIKRNSKSSNESKNIGNDYRGHVHRGQGRTQQILRQRILKYHG